VNCKFFTPVFAFAVLMMSGPFTSAGAQQAAHGGGPLFGDTKDPAGARKTTDLNVSLAEAYDSDAPEQLRSTVDPLNPQNGGFYTSLFASGNFNCQGNRLQVGATGG
jgi:hypothetical protein